MKRPTTPATALPAVDIIWNSGTLEQWGRLLDKVARVPLTQTFEYGVAMSRCERLLPRLGIIKLSGKTLGVVQVLERRILGFIHVVQIHRGPLWLGAEPDGAVQQAFFAALRREFPRALTRWVSLMPELMAGHENEALVARSGFRKSGGKGYETIWLDLARSEQDLRRSLAGNWRNHLSGAERGPLIVDVSTEGRELPGWRCAVPPTRRRGTIAGHRLNSRCGCVMFFISRGGCCCCGPCCHPKKRAMSQKLWPGFWFCVTIRAQLG